MTLRAVEESPTSQQVGPESAEVGSVFEEVVPRPVNMGSLSEEVAKGVCKRAQCPKK